MHRATVHWTASGDEAFVEGRYSRAHRWRFDGGADIAASASPHIVPTPWSDPAAVDPEEAMVAALASCHMLFFLDLASRQGLGVTEYRDDAVGVLGPGDDGALAMQAVTLFPQARFAAPVEDGIVALLHHRAHAACFLARSVRFPVTISAPIPAC